MSPSDVKQIRTHLGLTQKEMAKALGIATLSMSQYETGFRKPGPTIVLFFKVLRSSSKKRALEIVSLFQKAGANDLLDSHRPK